MGKKIIGVIAFAAIAAAAGWNYNQNNQKVELSDLALENVEALARGEGIDQNGYKYFNIQENNLLNSTLTAVW